MNQELSNVSELQICDRITVIKFTISGAIYRYYESRRKRFNDAKPSRVAMAAENRKKTRKIQEKKRVWHAIGYYIASEYLSEFYPVI